MNNKVLEPTITTLTVEISVLKIGNNKMTLSVFDQLYEEDCFDDYYVIKYPIWGKVKRNEFEYVVFQVNNSLRKMKIPEKGRRYNFTQSINISITDNDFVKTGYFLESAWQLWNDKIRSKKIVIQYDTSRSNLFLESLSDDEKKEVYSNFEKEDAKVTELYKMVDILKSSLQIFIAV